MKMFGLDKPWYNRVTAALIVLLTIFLRLTYGPRTVDDAYITFRYARNIADGIGFVFNPGERVLGTTTPLFTLLIAGAHSLRLEPAWFALIFSSLTDAMTALLLLQIVQTLSHSVVAGWIAATLFVFSSGSIIFTGGGMESGFFTSLVTLSVYLFLKHRFVWAAGVGAVATLTRPEGAIVLLLMGALYIWRFKRVPLGMISISLSIGLPWLVFATIYFGSPFPQSMLAKGSTYAFPPFTAIKSLLGYLVTYTLPLTDITLTRPLKYATVVAITSVGSVTALIYYRKSQMYGKEFPAILWCVPLVYLGAYTVANPPIWEWYVLPLVPFAVFVLSTGIVESVRLLANHRRERDLVTSGGLLAVLLISMALSLLNFQSVLKRDIRTGRELTYTLIAQQIKAIARPEDCLATPEIGTLGYYLPNVRVLDTQGLISPEAVPYRQEMLQGESTKDFQALWLASGMIPPALINEQKPRFVVAPDRLAERLLQDQNFMGSYQEILSKPSSLMGGARIVVWQRVEGKGIE